jgi:uncharacterized membrane protein YgdD (TMEM256/DUF423 family)
MSPKIWLILAALFGATGVTLGAYQAHGLDKFLQKRGDSPEVVEKRLAQCDVGVRYQMYHALALLGVGIWGLRLEPRSWANRLLAAAGLLVLAGILLFSGGLYLIVFSGDTDIASVVPFGGLAFILGWLALLGAALATGCCAAVGPSK